MDEEKKKYRLTKETRFFQGIKIYRIQALCSFAHVKEGQKGGFVENDTNLSQYDACWIDDDAIVCGDAWVHGNAQVQGHARVFDAAEVYGETIICDYARIFGKARITQQASVIGHAKISESAVVSDQACIKDYAEVGGNAWVYQQAVVGGWEKIGDYDRIISNSLDKKRFQRKLTFYGFG
ncbi:hypothetical protein O1F49_002224 [Enterococcus hirae]|nr:hypothetical protein [Enterococcus hirae]EMF0535596.1 hypothetical protein [Enterococcus hirae]